MEVLLCYSDEGNFKNADVYSDKLCLKLPNDLVTLLRKKSTSVPLVFK